MIVRLRTSLLATGLAIIGYCGEEGTGPATTTFNRDVAPLLFEHCSSCHRPAGSGPFNLATYEDARKRARQIVRVTRSGFMPPWLPLAGHDVFGGARGLTAEEIDVFRRWKEGGAVEGDLADLPPSPFWPDGWARGTPDLVLQMERPYMLYAEGVDV